MWNQLRVSLILMAIFSLLLGGAYPLAITALAQLVFPHQANGSLIQDDGRLWGSQLIGQQFSSPRYFWSRLSATAPAPYNGAASSGSNFGPLNPNLHSVVSERIGDLRQADASVTAVPVDLATASGSGLDPHISPASAELQVMRVAKARGIEENRVRELVQQHTQGRQWGVLGEPRVNVLELNLALDRLSTPR